MPYLGHATMVKVLRALIVPFGAIFVLLAFYDFSTGPRASRDSVVAGNSSRPVWPSPSHSPVSLDGVRQRLYPLRARDASKGSIVGWMFLGTAIPEIFMMVLGAATFTFISSSAQSAAWNGSNPFEALHIQHTIPSWSSRCF